MEKTTAHRHDRLQASESRRKINDPADSSVPLFLVFFLQFDLGFFVILVNGLDFVFIGACFRAVRMLLAPEWHPLDFLAAELTETHRQNLDGARPGGLALWLARRGGRWNCAIAPLWTIARASKKCPR
jgi:hypothetical protein